MHAWGLQLSEAWVGQGGLTQTACHQVFTLPKVSAKTKFKLTAHEGCRVRKVALATFASVMSEDYAETCLACLTNLGDVHVFSVPGLRPQVHYSCIRKEDISGIASCVFTRHGQGEVGQVAGSRCRVEQKAPAVLRSGGGGSRGLGRDQSSLRALVSCSQAST